jgi:hypothetical protein
MDQLLEENKAGRNPGITVGSKEGGIINKGNK